jgi:hypothetical protein
MLRLSGDIQPGKAESNIIDPKKNVISQGIETLGLAVADINPPID